MSQVMGPLTQDEVCRKILEAIGREKCYVRYVEGAAPPSIVRYLFNKKRRERDEDRWVRHHPCRLFLGDEQFVVEAISSTEFLSLLVEAVKLYDGSVLPNMYGLDTFVFKSGKKMLLLGTGGVNAFGRAGFEFVVSSAISN